jgi:hypothetical protein
MTSIKYTAFLMTRIQTLDLRQILCVMTGRIFSSASFVLLEVDSCLRDESCQFWHLTKCLSLQPSSIVEADRSDSDEQN